MLPKKSRADKKTIEMIFKKGKLLNSSDLIFKYIVTGQTSIPHISFIAPKGVAKLAVKRNLLRRRGYAVLKKYIRQFPTGLVGVFIFKKYQDDVLIIENEIKIILHKIN